MSVHWWFVSSCIWMGLFISYLCLVEFNFFITGDFCMVVFEWVCLLVISVLLDLTCLIVIIYVWLNLNMSEYWWFVFGSIWTNYWWFMSGCIWKWLFIGDFCLILIECDCLLVISVWLYLNMIVYWWFLFDLNWMWLFIGDFCLILIECDCLLVISVWS